MKKLLIIFIFIPLLGGVSARGGSASGGRGGFSFAQQNKIDSLITALQTATEDKNKIIILYELCYEYRISKPNKAIKYGKRGLILSEQLGIRDMVASGLTNIGIVYRLKYEYHKAIQYHLKALMIYKRSKSRIAVGWSLVEIGNDYYWQNNYTNSIKYYQKALAVFEKSDLPAGRQGFKHGIAVCLNNLGMIYEMQGDYVKAIEYYLYASNKYEVLENKKGIAWSFELIANIYLHQDDDSSAMKYYLMSLKIYEELNDKKWIAISYNNIGLVHNNQGNYSRALEYFFKALNIFEQLGIELKIAITSTHIGNIYVKTGELQQALNYQKKALGIQEKIADKNGIVHSLYGIGNTCNKSGKSSEAIKYLQRSITIAKELGMKTALKDAYKCLSTAYAQINDYQKAHDYYQKYAGLKDILYDETTSEKIAEIQAKYEAGKKEREIELLSKENELQSLELIKNRIMVYAFSGGFGLVLILALVSVRAYRQKQKINEQLEKNVEERTLELSISNEDLQAEINERKEVVNALLESEGKFRALVESTTAVTLIIQDDKFAYVNPATQKLIGYSADELYSMLPWNLIHPDHQNEIETRAKLRLKGKKVPDQYETVMLAKNGENIWLDVSACLINYKDKPAILATGFDITERKKAELLQSVSYNIAKAANRRITDINALSKAIHTEICKVIDAKNFYIALYNESEGTYVFQYCVDEYEQDAEFAPEELDRSLTDYVRKMGKPLLADEKVHNQLMSQGEVDIIGEPSKVWLGVPLKGEGKTVGVMAVQSYDNENAYSESDLKFLKFVSGQVGRILERQLIVEEMLRSEEYYRTISEKATDVVTVHDTDGKIMYISKSVKVILGYQSHELIGKNVLKYIHLQDRSKIKNDFKEKLETNHSTKKIELRFRHKNGSWRVMEAIARNLTNDHIINGIVVNSRDITENKIAEEAIRESEQKHRMLIETMKEGVIQVAKNDIIEFVNEQFCKMIGYSEQELLGKSAATLFLGGTDKVFMGKFKSISEKGSSAQNIVQLRKKDGKFIRALISGSTNYDEHKNTIGSTAVVTDITKIMEYEENLDKINQELNTFIYKASHDLMGPLSSSVGIVNMCKENIDDMNILSNLDLISSSLDKLDRILQDLTQITLIRQGQLKILPIKVKPLLDNIIQTFSHYPDFEKTNVIIEHKLRRPLASDAEILGIILRNLFENALKYRKIGAENSFIKITTASKNKKVVITIADNGIGIPIKYHKSIYNMFVRASTISWGSGLGLYSVKNAVEKLKGTIKLKSKENKGTTFTLHLPDMDR